MTPYHIGILIGLCCGICIGVGLYAAIQLVRS